MSKKMEASNVSHFTAPVKQQTVGNCGLSKLIREVFTKSGQPPARRGSFVGATGTVQKTKAKFRQAVRGFIGGVRRREPGVVPCQSSG